MCIFINLIWCEYDFKSLEETYTLAGVIKTFQSYNSEGIAKPKNQINFGNFSQAWILTRKHVKKKLWKEQKKLVIFASNPFIYSKFHNENRAKRTF